MTSQHDKSKRWRLRFSVRTMVIVVTLVCCYAACWGPTERRGVGDVNATMEWGGDGEILGRPSATAPLIVGIDNALYHFPREPLTRRQYYFWFWVIPI